MDEHGATASSDKAPTKWANNVLMDIDGLVVGRNTIRFWQEQAGKVDALTEQNAGLLTALKYARRFLDPSLGDFSAIDTIIDKADGAQNQAQSTGLPG